MMLPTPCCVAASLTIGASCVEALAACDEPRNATSSDDERDEATTRDSAANAKIQAPAAGDGGASNRVPPLTEIEAPADEVPQIRTVTNAPTSPPRKKRGIVAPPSSSRILGRGGSSPPSSIPQGRSQGFVDGDFRSGRVHSFSPPSGLGCFVLSHSPDASFLALGLTHGGGLALYETGSYNLIHVIEISDTVSALDWSVPPSTTAEVGWGSGSFYLAIGDFSGTVSIYEVARDREVLELSGAVLLNTVQVGSEVRALGFATCEGISGGVGVQSEDIGCFRYSSPPPVVIGEKGGKVSTWGPRLGLLESVPPSFVSKNENGVFYSDPGSPCVGWELVHSYSHNGPVLALAFSPDGTMVATGSKDGIVRIHGRSTGSAVFGSHTRDLQRRGAVRSLTFSPNSSRLVVGGYDRTLALFDAKLWQAVRELPTDGTVNAARYDPRMRYLAVGSRDKKLTLFDTSTYRPVKVLKTQGWVSDISWGLSNADEAEVLVVRGANKSVSVLDLSPTRLIDTKIPSGRGLESSLSWSHCGRFLARARGNEVSVADSESNFTDVASARRGGAVRCVRFGPKGGAANLVAVVGNDGYLCVYRLSPMSGGLFGFDLIHSVFLEEFLWTVAWSSDGENLCCGGRGKKLFIVSSSDLIPRCLPIEMKGRVWAVDFLPRVVKLSLGESAHPLGLAVGTGDYVCTLFDDRTFQPAMKVLRLRTVRSLKFHPHLPILAVGDGGHLVGVVDLLEGLLLREIRLDGRVHCIDFSACGDFMVIATDDCFFALVETETFSVVQHFPTKSGIALSAAFSGSCGKYLAMDSESGDTSLLRLGPFLSIPHFPLTDPTDDIKTLPAWVTSENIYRSGMGPSLVQRCMQKNTSDSTRLAVDILQNHPEAIYTFDRTNGKGCFETVMDLGKPVLLKLVMKILVDGTLEEATASDGRRTVLTTRIPNQGYAALRALLSNGQSDSIVETFRSMTFLKVPFTEPRYCSSTIPQECASSTFTDPWDGKLNPKRVLKRSSPATFSDDDNKGEVLLTPAVLPLPGLGSLDFLSALTTECSDPDAFDTEAMGIVLRVMWRNYVRTYFLIDLSLYVVFFVLWIVFIDQTSETTSDDFERPYWTTLVLGSMVMIGNTLFTLKEVIQAGVPNFHGWSHLRDVWNVTDVCAGILVFSYTIPVFANSSGGGPVPLAVVTTLSLTLKLLAYLRGFNSTGWLISVLIANFKDIRGFLVVLVTILVGFTGAFRLLFGDVEGECIVVLESADEQLAPECDRDPYGSIAHSLLSTFELAIIGSYDPGIFGESQHPALAALTFVCCVCVVLVVALNALIAILSDSYSRVQEHANANRRKEKAGLIVEYLHLLPRKKRESIERETKYFHALLQADIDGDLLVKADDWQGGLNALKQQIVDLNETSTDSTRAAIENAKEVLNADMQQLRFEVTSLLTEMRSEIKELRKLHDDGGITFKGQNVVKAVKTVKSVGSIPGNIGANIGGRIGSMLKHGPSARSFSSDDASTRDEKDE